MPGGLSAGLVSRLSPVIVHDIRQGFVEGILTEKLAELVATLRFDIVHDLRDDQPDPFLLQQGENRPQRLRR